MEALERMQLSYSPEQSSGLMEASSDATRDQFSTDRFIGGSRIHSASSSSSSQPFSPVVADPNAERMRMVGLEAACLFSPVPLSLGIESRSEKVIPCFRCGLLKQSFL